MYVEATYKLPDGFKRSNDVSNKVLSIACSTIKYELKKHNYFYIDSSISA